MQGGAQGDGKPECEKAYRKKYVPFDIGSAETQALSCQKHLGDIKTGTVERRIGKSIAAHPKLGIKKRAEEKNWVCEFR